MAYLFIALALLCNTTKGFCGKKTSTYVEQTDDAVRFSLLRMVFCILIGFAMVLFEQAQSALLPDLGMFAICLLAGASNTMFLVCWMMAVRKNTMVSIDVSLTLGSMIPAILCAVLFGEIISGAKMIGFALIVLATIILSGHNKQTGKSGNRLVAFLLLLCAMIGDGLVNFSQQLYKHFYTEAGLRAGEIFYPKTIYHFYTYVFSALTLLIILMIYRAYTKKKAIPSQQEKSSFSKKSVAYITVLALCLFAANYFQTVAANDYGMPSQILYPILKGGSLITVNFTAMIFFGEKITLRSILGSLVALLGIIFMNVL